jgi:hypothetical protein
MTTWYKLTDKDGYTRKNEANQCIWGENITHTAAGKSSLLCTSGFIHVYRHPLIAAFMNPIHADFENPLLWECEANGECAHEGQLKSGFRSVTTLRLIDLPVISLEQRVRISIYCALKQYSEPSFVKWAQGWLDGSNRSTAEEVARAEWAEWAAARAAAWAARAAEAATRAEWAARAAEEVARAARAAARAAADAEWAAARAAEFDLLVIIKSVVEDGK